MGGGIQNGRVARGTPPFSPFFVDSCVLAQPSFLVVRRAFHIASINALNSIMRKYNAQAPYAVRRAPLMFKVELDSCITASIPFITNELQRRLDGGGLLVELPPSKPRVDREILGHVVGEEGEQKAVEESMWKAFRRVLVEVLGNTGSLPNAVK